MESEMKPLMENWRQYMAENQKTITAYHGSNVPIRKFSRDHGAQGVMWFSEDKEKIIAGESGALSTKYIMKVELAVEKTTGWDDYDKKFLQQIENEGFDSIQLDDNWIVFDPSRVKVIGIEEQSGDPVDALITAIRKVRKDRPEDTESGGFTTWSGHFYTYLKAYKKMRGKNPEKAAKYLSNMISDAERNYGMSHEAMISEYIPDALPHWQKIKGN